MAPFDLQLPHSSSAVFVPEMDPSALALPVHQVSMQLTTLSACILRSGWHYITPRPFFRKMWFIDCSCMDITEIISSYMNPLSHRAQLLACLEMHTFLIMVCMKMTAADGRETSSLLQSNSIDSSDYFTPHSSCRSGELNCSRKSCPMTEPLTTVYVHCVHKVL